MADYDLSHLTLGELAKIFTQLVRAGLPEDREHKEAVKKAMMMQKPVEGEGEVIGMSEVLLEGKFIVGFYRYDLPTMAVLGKEPPSGEFKATAWMIQDGRPRRLGCAFGSSKGDALRGLEVVILNG